MIQSKRILFNRGSKTIYGTALVIFTILALPLTSSALEQVQTLQLFTPGYYQRDIPFKHLRNDIGRQFFEANVRIQSDGLSLKYATVSQRDIDAIALKARADACALAESAAEVLYWREYHKPQITLVMVDESWLKVPIRICSPSLVLIGPASYGGSDLVGHLEAWARSNRSD